MAEKFQTAEIPVLTEMVDPTAGPTDAPLHMETLIAELQTELAASAFALADQLLHNALTEMEATLLEQVSARLRRELPELVDGILRRHFGREDDV